MTESSKTFHDPLYVYVEGTHGIRPRDRGHGSVPRNEIRVSAGIPPAPAQLLDRFVHRSERSAER